MSGRRGLSYYLLTLGCPKNEVDSDLLDSRLTGEGWWKAEDPRDASLLIVNTCSFIAPALEESIEEVLELAELKSETGARLAVAGCMVARYGRRRLESLLPEVDLFISFAEYERLDEVLEAVADHPSTARVCRRGGKRTLASTLGRGFVYVKIAEGCARRCSFCAIPAIRGRLRSRAMEEVVDEVRSFVDRGAREVVLVAQDTTQYGMDIYGKPSLPALIEGLAELEGDFRLRIKIGRAHV